MPGIATREPERRMRAGETKSDHLVVLDNPCRIDAKKEDLMLRLGSLKRELKKVETKLDRIRAEERKIKLELRRVASRKARVACPTGAPRTIDFQDQGVARIK